MLRAALRSGAAQRRAVFEVFARHLPHGRRYGVVAGTGRLLDAVARFRFGPDATRLPGRCRSGRRGDPRYLEAYAFSGDIWGYAEGDCYFPGSPILVVEATFAEAVVLETLVLSILNHDCAIASAASRMVTAAGDRPLIEMGSRRTHELAAVASARAAYIAGFDLTSNLRAGHDYGVPTSGTAAHAFTLVHDSERDAFRAQVDALGPGTTLLVDTYDVAAAVRTAVEVAGPGLGAVRIDSGDLARGRARRCARCSTRSARPRPGSWSPATWTSTRSPRWRPPRWTATGSARRWSPGPARRPRRWSTSWWPAPTSPGTPCRCAPWPSTRWASRGAPGASGRCAAATPPGRRVAELVTTVPADPGPGDRVLLQPLIRGGEIVGREPLEAARSRHREVIAELPAHALQLSRGYPAIPTVFGPDGD